MPSNSKRGGAPVSPFKKLTKREQEARLVAMASTIVQRAQFAQQAGLTFNNQRNVAEACGYKDLLAPTDFWRRYLRNAIAARVVEIFPKATWRGDAELVEDEDPETVTEFEAAWAEMAVRLDAWATLMRADILAGLGHFSVILIGAPGEFQTELPKVRGPEDIYYLAPYSELDVTIDTYVANPSDPRFGLPMMYSFQRTQAQQQSTSVYLTPKNVPTIGRIVHWSRVVHIADGMLDDRVNGQPRLERVWNLLDDLEKLTGAGSEGYWQRSNQGFHFTLDKDVTVTPDDKAEWSEQIDQFMHGLRRYTRMRGVNVDTTSSDAAGFSTDVDSIIGLIAAGAEIPQRIFLGSERGQLASGQDDENWQDRIRDRRDQFAEPVCVRQLVDRLITANALPEPDQYDVRWPEIVRLNDLERAEMGERWASINQAYEATGRMVILPNEIRDRVLLLPPIEEIAEPEDLVLPPPPQSNNANAQPENQDEQPIDDENDNEEPAAKEGKQKAAAAAQKDTAVAARLTPLLRVGREVDAVAFVRHFKDRKVAPLLRDLEPALSILRDSLDEFLPDVLQRALEVGAQHAFRATRHAALVTAARRPAFKPDAAAVAKWVAQAATRHASTLSDQAAVVAEDVIARAIRERWTPERAARLILGNDAGGGILGLSDKQAEAVLNLRSKLLNAEPGTKVKAGAQTYQVPKSGASASLVQRATSTYSEQLRRQRALVIARSWMRDAEASGQRLHWQQMQEVGALRTNVRREWAAMENACPLCDELDGQRRALGSPYRTEDGETFDGPPRHPNCRCEELLIDPSDRGAAGFDPGQERDPGGQWVDEGGGDAESRETVLKRRRALKNFKPATAKKQQMADDGERDVRTAIKGERTDDNAAFDVLVRAKDGSLHAVEVKTLTDNIHDKITMHKSSLDRKRSWGDVNHATVHTVVLDRRPSRQNSGHEVYYANDLGSMRIGAMRKTSMRELRRVMGIDES